MLDEVCQRDAGIIISWGWWNKCSAGLLHGVFDKGAGLRLWQGCWVSVWQGSKIVCLTGMLDCLLVTDAGLRL